MVDKEHPEVEQEYPKVSDFALPAQILHLSNKKINKQDERKTLGRLTKWIDEIAKVKDIFGQKWCFRSPPYFQFSRLSSARTKF